MFSVFVLYLREVQERRVAFERLREAARDRRLRVAQRVGQILERRHEPVLPVPSQVPDVAQQAERRETNSDEKQSI